MTTKLRSSVRSEVLTAGAMLRAIRVGAGMSLGDLSRATGIRITTLSGIERGTDNCTRDTAHDIGVAIAKHVTTKTEKNNGDPGPDTAGGGHQGV